MRPWGHSLLELLITLAIILILFAILLPHYARMLQRVRTLEQTYSRYLTENPLLKELFE
ncbi:MAG: prepilin-type N-terminal cleavage/methylation domain-containing protein [Armatimonadota bacterium]